MSSSGQKSDVESPMTFGDAAVPAEAVMSSGSSSASPGALEAGIGMIPVSSLPRVPEPQPSTPRKRSLPLGDVMGSPETPSTRFRAQLTGGHFSTSDDTRVVAYQPLREWSQLQSKVLRQKM